MDINTELYNKIKYLPYKLQEHLLDYINLLLEKDLFDNYKNEDTKSQKEHLLEAFSVIKDTDMFADIEDVELWQKQIRDEWEERSIR